MHIIAHVWCSAVIISLVHNLPNLVQVFPVVVTKLHVAKFSREIAMELFICTGTESTGLLTFFCIYIYFKLKWFLDNYLNLFSSLKAWE